MHLNVLMIQVYFSIYTSFGCGFHISHCSFSTAPLHLLFIFFYSYVFCIVFYVKKSKDYIN